MHAAGVEPVMTAAREAQRLAERVQGAAAAELAETFANTTATVRRFFGWRGLSVPDCAVSVGGTVSAQVRYGPFFAVDVEVGATCSIPVIASDLARLIVDVDPGREAAAFRRMRWWDQLAWLLDGDRLAAKAQLALAPQASCGELGLGNLKRVGGLDQNLWMLAVTFWAAMALTLAVWSRRRVGGFRPPPLNEPSPGDGGLALELMQLVRDAPNPVQALKTAAVHARRKAEAAEAAAASKARKAKQAAVAALSPELAAARERATDQLLKDLGWGARAAVREGGHILEVHAKEAVERARNGQ
jgi:hypothetical protein